MDRLAAYIKEREGFDTIVRKEGFIAYRIEGDTCQIYDVFVFPDFRQGGIATVMAKQVEDLAREAGCKYFTGTVIPSSRCSTDSAKFVLSYGLKIHSAAPNAIFFRKEL